MARMRRAVIGGHPYHITQRGVDQRPVFREDRDREVYLELLLQMGEKYHLTFEGYCLMSNHVHLVAVPEGDDSLHRGLKWAHATYSRYFHARHGGCGHLWQARFYSCFLDGPYHWRALAYVEMNPVRAGLVNFPEEYGWSSAQGHLGLGDARLRIGEERWRSDWDEVSWRAQLVAMGADDKFWKRLQDSTRTGRPLAYEDTVIRLEEKLGWRLRPGKRGPKARAAG